jgi:tetratricopeptide (TPR) repeat protein
VFYGPDLAARVTTKLAEYARDWEAAYRAAAEATLLRGEESPATLERRHRCLERGREQLGALASVLSEADAAVATRALDAAYALPSPAWCATSDAAAMPALPASPELRIRVLAAERSVSSAAALQSAGRDREAAALVERALPDVRAIPLQRLEAELLLVLSLCARWSGDNTRAFSLDQQAMHAAARAGDYRLVARAAAGASFVLSGWLGNAQEGERWVDLADSIAERTGRDDALDVEILGGRIVTTSMLGRPGDTMALHDKQIAAAERLYGERDPRLATIFMNRGVSRSILGEYELGLEDFQRGIDILESVSGTDNPHLDLFYFNLGSALCELDRPEEGKVALDHALALEGDRPAGSITVSICAALANVESDLGHNDEAIRIADRGLEVANAIGTTSATSALTLLIVRGRARARNGDLASQAADCGRALSLQRALGPLAAGPYGPDALSCLGEAELARQEVAAALAHLEEDVRLESRRAPEDLPRARFALARALRETGRDPARAVQLARDALEALRSIRSHEREAGAIETWLAR